MTVSTINENYNYDTAAWYPNKYINRNKRLVKKVTKTIVTEDVEGKKKITETIVEEIYEEPQWQPYQWWTIAPIMSNSDASNGYSFIEFGKTYT